MLRHPPQLRWLCSSKDTEAKLYAIFIVAINALILCNFEEKNGWVKTGNLEILI